MMLNKASTRLWVLSNNKGNTGKSSHPVNVETLKLHPAETIGRCTKTLANSQLTKNSSDPRIGCS